MATMPRTLRKALPRMNVRIPTPVISEIERIVTRHPELYINRQQFIESAIREEIKRITLMDTTATQRTADDRSIRVKEILFAHAIANAIKDESAPNAHLNPKQIVQIIRRLLIKRAKREGKKITETQLDELTEDLLEYYKEITEGLTLVKRS